MGQPVCCERHLTKGFEGHRDAADLGTGHRGRGSWADSSGAVLAMTPVGRCFLRHVAMALDADLPSELPAARPVFSRTV